MKGLQARRRGLLGGLLLCVRGIGPSCSWWREGGGVAEYGGNGFYTRWIGIGG
jgi:hypothetical protein